MFVAASTATYPELSLEETLERLAHLQFSYVEIELAEREGRIRPSELAEHFEQAVSVCRAPHRLTPAAYFVEPEPGPNYYDQFAECCRLATATKVVTLIVRGSELGTPFNEEVDRLKQLSAIAQNEGVRVGLKTETGCMSEDPSTVKMMCDNVKGLGVTLDPSHLLYGPNQGRNYDQLLPYVYHVQLRDSTKSDLQVRMGQGEIDYGRIVQVLGGEKYDRALTVDVLPGDESIDRDSELRKARLLLESLL